MYDFNKLNSMLNFNESRRDAYTSSSPIHITVDIGEEQQSQQEESVLKGVSKLLTWLKVKIVGCCI